MNQECFSIADLSVDEKLALMEKIWLDLEGGIEKIPTPGWHETVLKSRLEMAEDGKRDFIDWQIVKSRLQNRFK